MANDGARERWSSDGGQPRDGDLLRAYVDEKSEAAFGELVRRHVNLVYGIALRQCGGDAHLAEDVAQQVFTDLARKARALMGHAVLGGWLYRSTQFTASDVVRAERRRRTREQEVHAMQEISRPTVGDADWQKLAPVLDEAIGQLPERDRDAVVLRCIEARPFAEIGATLRLTEDAARMRVERALDKLRSALSRRGITSTRAALGVALANQAGVAAPAGVAASVTSIALAGATTGSGMVASFGLMGISKVQIAVVGAIVAAGVALVIKGNANVSLRAELASPSPIHSEIAQLRTENLRLANNLAEAEALRRDDSTVVGLRAEAATLTAGKQASARARAEARLRSAQAELATAITRYSEQHPTIIRYRRLIAALEISLGRGVFDESVYEAAALDVSPVSTPYLRTSSGPSGRAGEVWLSFVVSATGEISEVVATKSTSREIEEVAIEALKQQAFAPGLLKGVPVNARVEIPMIVAPNPTAMIQASSRWF